MDPVTQMIFLITALLVLGSLGEWIFSRTGIPDIIWLVVAGLVAGPWLNWVSADMLRPVLPFFGAFALVTVLSSGGLSLRISELSQSAARASVLAVCGFVISVLAIAVFLKLLTWLGHVQGDGWAKLLMIGAIVGGSSSVVIIPTMQAGNVKSSIANLLNVESSITDALCVVMAVLMIDLVLSSHMEVEYPFILLGKAVGIGIGMGVLAGLLYLPLAHLIHGKGSAYPLMLAFLLLTYALINIAGGNGALGILAASLLVGNAPWLIQRIVFIRKHILRPERLAIDRDAMAFHSQVIFLVKSFFFFLIGLMFPTSPKLILIGIACAFILWLARYPATWLALRNSGLSDKDRHLVAVAMPRGLAAGVMSAAPLAHGVPGVEHLTEGVFAMIVASIVIFAVGFSLFNRDSSK